jgi:seryl-tRNA synthetase
MTKYAVEVVDNITLKYRVEVEAENPAEAMELAIEKVYDGEVKPNHQDSDTEATHCAVIGSE